MTIQVNQQNIVALTSVMFNAAPGANNLSDFESNYTTLESLADNLAATDAFNDQFTSGSSLETDINQVLSQNLGIEKDSEAYDSAYSFFEAKLATGENPGSILAQASTYLLGGEADPLFDDAVALLQNKVKVGTHYSVDAQRSGDLETLKSVYDGVSTTSASVDEAISDIDDMPTEPGDTDQLLMLPSEIHDQYLDSEEFFTVEYTALNNSGTSGGAFLGLDTDTDTLTVITTGSGVEAGSPHPQHIHGFSPDADGNIPDSQSPTFMQDGDGDGYVELGEGAMVYGAIQLSLTDPAGGALSDFPTTDDGVFVQATSYDLGAMTNADGDTLSEVLTATNLDQREIVLHGVSLDGSQGMGTEGQANGEAGYKAVLPIAAGEIERLDANQALMDFQEGQLTVAGDAIAFEQADVSQAMVVGQASVNTSPESDMLS